MSTTDDGPVRADGSKFPTFLDLFENADLPDHLLHRTALSRRAFGADAIDPER